MNIVYMYTKNIRYKKNKVHSLCMTDLLCLISFVWCFVLAHPQNWFLKAKPPYMKKRTEFGKTLEVFNVNILTQKSGRTILIFHLKKKKQQKRIETIFKIWYSRSPQPFMCPLVSDSVDHIFRMYFVGINRARTKVRNFYNAL